MAIKRWIMHKVNRVNAAPDAPAAGAIEPGLGHVPGATSAAGYGGRDGGALAPEQLGEYAALVAALRDELVHFATTQLRLHRAIAERDRYLLTAMEVECVDGSDGGDVLTRFLREFTPEQIKRFIARGVIGQLPNASAIDLTQFAGLRRPIREPRGPADDDRYADLIAELRADTPSEGPRSFEVRLIGHWTEGEGAEAVVPAAAEAAVPVRTPLAGHRIVVAIDDASGARTVTLAGVIAGRRYSIGTGPATDIVVHGTYASRRHCHVWSERDAWWVQDAGSTNGLRIESAGVVLARQGGPSGSGEPAPPSRIPRGATIVLSAQGQGAASDYPHLRLELPRAARGLVTPLAPAAATSTRTPVTSIVAQTPGTAARAATLRIDAAMHSGTKTFALEPGRMPVRVGRSRSQDLVVDWIHEGVSGTHVEIVRCDDEGAEVDVHGDNGVTIGGVVHARGQRVRWRPGETMALGRASGDEPLCTLVLAVEAADDAGGKRDNEP